MFGDTHARGGGGDRATSMATWLSSSLRNENGKLKIFVVRTTLLAKSPSLQPVSVEVTPFLSQMVLTSCLLFFSGIFTACPLSAFLFAVFLASMHRHTW